MADVTIDAVAVGNTRRVLNALVCTSASVGYKLFIDSDSDFKYYKTTDGVASWSGPTTICTGTVGAAGAQWDQDTPGNSGTLIHSAYIERVSGEVRYRTLDSNGDALGTEQVIFANGSAFPLPTIGTHCSIAKMRGGNLYVAFSDGTSVSGLYRSTDGGANWSSRTSPIETALGDWAILFPGNESDNQDLWILYFDASANALTLKLHDDSADSNSESSTIASVTESTNTAAGYWPCAGAIRHSDGHLIVVSHSQRDNAATDFLAFDINGTGSISALTAITTDIDDNYHASVYIDNNTDDIYVAYNGKTDGSETLFTGTAGTGTSGIYYKKTTDGGSTWSAGDTAYSESTGDFAQTWTPMSGDRFAVSWAGGEASPVLYTNAVNSLDLSGGGGGLSIPIAMYHYQHHLKA